jgi:hypothetical protein
MCDILGTGDINLPLWRDTLRRLTPYPTSSEGFLIGQGVRILPLRIPYPRS